MLVCWGLRSEADSRDWPHCFAPPHSKDLELALRHSKALIVQFLQVGHIWAASGM